MSFHSIRAVVPADAVIPAEETDAVISGIEYLVNHTMFEFEKRAIIQAVTAIPAQAQQAVMTCAQQLIGDDMDGFDIGLIIKAIIAVPADERELVTFYTKRLAVERMSAESIKTVIRGVAAIPAQQRKAVITATQHFLTEAILDYEIRTIIEAISAVSDDQIEIVIRYAKQFVNEKTSARSIKAVIQGVAAISAHQRKEVITATQHFVTDSMDGLDVKAIINAITAIPADEREIVTRYAKQLVNEKMDAGSKKAVIEGVIAIPSQQGEAVVARARQLILDGMDGRTRQIIIKAIVLGADRLITPEMSIDSMRAINRTVSDVPADEREEVVTNALLLITPQMSPAERVEVIQTVADILPNEREGVTNLALQAITQDMRGDNRLTIIRALTHVPLLERANVMEHAVQFFNAHIMNPLVDDRARAMMIQNLANRPQDQRADYMQQQRQQLQAHAVRNPQADYQQGIDVHAGDRDHRVRRAIELLRLHQGEIDEAIINQAVEGFTQYLDNREMDPEHKRLARRALLEPKVEGEHFGPLISDLSFTILGLEISGRELIGRFWIFASQLTEPEQGNAKHSMILALKDSYSAGDNRICNQGKTQRLIVGVLQGRLQGVDIELIAQMQVTTEQAADMFFVTQAHRDIQDLEPLLDAANRFCALNPNVNREDFIRFLKENYARVQGMIE